MAPPIALLLAGALYAQSNRAKITGRVIDATSASLQGAQVQVLPKAVTVVSDVKGEFRIADLAPGEYKLVVNYVGFKTSETAVQVQAADVKHIDLHMEVASQAESIIVSADRPHAEAIERSRNTGNVVQVLSGEVIRSLPNANVADALGRLPSVTLFRDEGEGAYVLIRGTEPRLTNMMINGVTIPWPEATAQQVRLDALPAGGGRAPPFAPPAKSSCTSPSPISSSAANRSALVGWRAGVDGKQHGTRHRNN